MLKLQGKLGPPPPSKNFPCNFNIFNIFNISREMLKFSFLQLQHLQHFPSFKHIFHQKMLKTGEMLKIVAILQGLHLQHFPCFKHFFTIKTTGEMLKMLKLENPKLQHFPGNVEDVEDVEVAGEIFSPPPPPKISRATSTSSTSSTFPGKC